MKNKTDKKIVHIRVLFFYFKLFFFILIKSGISIGKTRF